ncbi:hypothetical protein ACJX0J_012014, partial [Zea mays]
AVGPNEQAVEDQSLMECRPKCLGIGFLAQWDAAHFGILPMASSISLMKIPYMLEGSHTSIVLSYFGDSVAPMRIFQIYPEVGWHAEIDSPCMNVESGNSDLALIIAVNVMSTCFQLPYLAKGRFVRIIENSILGNGLRKGEWIMDNKNVETLDLVETL